LNQDPLIQIFVSSLTRRITLEVSLSNTIIHVMGIEEEKKEMKRIKKE
jgi:hypothetical protein